MRHIWSILCRKAIVDPDTNLISLHDSLEEISLNLPIEAKGKNINIPIEFEIVSYWIAGDKKSLQHGESIVEVYDPTDKLISKFEQKIEFQNNSYRLRTRLRISGIGLTTSGEYKFTVKYKMTGDKKYEEAAELPLFVNLNFKSKKN